MSDPRRIASDGDARERAVLGGAAAFAPPPGARDEVWAALSLALPVTGGAAGGAASGGAASGGAAGGAASGGGASATAGAVGAGKVAVGAASLAVKVGLVSGGLLLLGAGVYRALPTRQPASRSAEAGMWSAPAPVTTGGATPSSAEPPPSAEGRAPGPLLAEAAPLRPHGGEARALRPEPSKRRSGRSALARPAVEGEVKPEAAPAPESQAAEARASLLREESETLSRARALLSSGDAAGALALTRLASTRYPAGVLGQEREVIAVEALARLGRKDEAAARARAFVAAHPTSAHAARMATFAGP